MTMMNLPPSLNNSDSSQSRLTDKSRAARKDQAELVQWVSSQFKQAKDARWKAERQWMMNMAFYFGQQNVQFRTSQQVGNSNFQLWVPPAPYYRSRPVINLIRPRVRTEMAKLTAQKPNAFVVPASSDDRDMYAAHAGEQIWDSFYRWKKLHSVIRRAIFWTSVTGNGFIKCFWDENAVDTVSEQRGDVIFDPVTPFHLFVPDLKEEELENQPFVIHAQMRTAEQLRNLFGRDVQFEAAKGDLLEQTFLNVMGIQNWKQNEQMLVLEVWARPGAHKLLPNGGMFIIAGTEIMAAEEEWPYQHNMYPFAKIGHVATGKFYTDSVITDLISPQKEYNRTRGQIIESKNRMAKPQLAAEIGSIDVTKLTSEPGQVVLYRPGFQPPQPIPLQSLPSYVLEEQERIKADMDEISGQHEVSRGQVPPGVTAATAISYLQEQDESKLSYTFDSLEEAIEKVAHMSLNYVVQFWDTQRMVKVTGADGSFDVMAFAGSDLKGNTDIRIEAGSALPTSKAAKQAFIMDLMKMGFIDPNKGLEVMEIGGINKIYEQVQIDVRQAQRENLRMAQATGELLAEHQANKLEEFIQSEEGQQLAASGMLQMAPDGQTLLDVSPVATGMDTAPRVIEVPLLVPVNTWDDHRIHIQRHNNYRKSQAFEQLPPEAKQLFEDHVRQHVSAIMVGAMGAMPPDMVMPEMMSDPESYKETEQMVEPSVPPEEL